MSVLLGGGFVDVPLFAAGTAGGVASSVAGAAEIAAAGGVTGVGLTSIGAAAEGAMAAEALATTAAIAGAEATIPVVGWVLAGLTLLAGTAAALVALHNAAPIGVSASPLVQNPNKSTAVAVPVKPESGVNMPLPGDLSSPGVPTPGRPLRPKRPKKGQPTTGGPETPLLLGPGQVTYEDIPLRRYREVLDDFYYDPEFKGFFC
nr:hypothetical protein [Sobelivirales sp.]WRQ65713.1 hypothetical protein [Tolivirales sp.]